MNRIWIFIIHLVWYQKLKSKKVNIPTVLRDLESWTQRDLRASGSSSGFWQVPSRLNTSMKDPAHDTKLVKNEHEWVDLLAQVS